MQKIYANGKADATLKVPTMTGIHTILLPARPQTDTIIAIFLLRSFGDEKFPGIKEAKIESTFKGPQTASFDSLLAEGQLALDMADGPFDHHSRGGTASQLVAHQLGIENDQMIGQLLQLAERDDKLGKGTLSTDQLDRAFGLAGLITALNKSFPGDPNTVIDRICAVLEGHLAEQRRRFTELPQEFEEKKKNNQVVEFRFVQGGTSMKGVFIVSDSLSIAGWLRSRLGPQADVIVQQRSSGHVNILTKQERKIELSVAAALIRSAEMAERGNTAELDMQTLARPGTIAEVPNWYYDTATNSLLNGGSTPDSTEPTVVPHSYLLTLVRKGLENS